MRASDVLLDSMHLAATHAWRRAREVLGEHALKLGGLGFTYTCARARSFPGLSRKTGWVKFTCWMLPCIERLSRKAQWQSLICEQRE